MSEEQGVEITVEYCVPCSYLARAQWMIGEIMYDIQDDVRKLEMRTGDGGCFEWSVDGELVFSKKQSGRFPEIDELKELIYSRV
ncbi:MAG: SelT/SelW/SelH family protein [Chloroflexi bacterium]|nr:SelT/SelW/SelH family protein [Chloroflexota bacterium]